MYFAPTYNIKKNLNSIGIQVDYYEMQVGLDPIFIM